MNASKNLETLAREIGRELGYEGRAGGWIYNPRGVAVYQGWYAYGRSLMWRGKIRWNEETRRYERGSREGTIEDLRR